LFYGTTISNNYIRSIILIWLEQQERQSSRPEQIGPVHNTFLRALRWHMWGEGMCHRIWWILDQVFEF